MLDCEPPDTDEPSEWDNGGVSVPDVTVLERERVARPGRENTRGSLTTNGRLARAICEYSEDHLRDASNCSPCAMSADSSKLFLLSWPVRALVILSPPNCCDDVDAMDGFDRMTLLGSSIVENRASGSGVGSGESSVRSSSSN